MLGQHQSSFLGIYPGTAACEVAPSLLCVQIYSLVIEKDICDCQNVVIKLPCVFVCVSYGDLGKIFLFLCYRTLVLSLSTWSLTFNRKVDVQRLKYLYRNQGVYRIGREHNSALFASLIYVCCWSKAACSLQTRTMMS